MCGYSLKRAEAIFGSKQIEFTRVVDEAGALTHQDRRELMRALEDLERNLPPIVLGIYITADGQAQEFRSHAHWALNHARIHHPSFGRREKMRAIEDADFIERRPGESHESAPPPPGLLGSWWQKLRAAVRDVLHPYPPPVQQEWMLILVLDVQLERACFTWGYMLDPYVNPDSINSCIMGARLQFRERAMAVGLRKVMKAAVTQIASQSYRVNRRLRRSLHMPGLALLLGLGMLCSPMQAAPSTPWADEEVAEEVEEEAPAAPAAPAQQKGAPGAAASYAAPPRWADEEYRHLLSGELGGCYGMLLSKPQPTEQKGTKSPQKSANDAKALKHFQREYTNPGDRGLIDPQRLLSNVERADIEHTLHVLNARAPYHMYIALIKQGQELPLELAVGSLVRTVARPGEYAVMLLYSTGDAPQVELGYHEITLSDEDRHAWLEKVRHAAARRGGGVAGLMAAAHQLHECLAPVVADLPPLTQRSVVNVPLIPLELREDESADEVTLKDEVRSILENPSLRPWALSIVGAIFLALLVAFIIWLRRRSGQLHKTEPDIRLSSPYGAGVSRSVQYLEGMEVKKSPRVV